MKALEKDRNRRYDTASELADDIQRYLDGEAVEAGPVTWSYRAQKFWKKHKAAIASFDACSFALILGLMVAVGAWLQTNSALARETEARQELEESKFAAEEQRKQAQEQDKRAVTEAEHSKRTLELVLEVLSQSGVDPSTGKEFAVSEALDLIGDRIDAGLDLQPDTAAELCLGLARAFLSSG